MSEISNKNHRSSLTKRKKALSQKKVNLSSYKTTYGELRRLREDIFKNLGDKIFEIQDWNTFLFETLKQINPVAKWVQNNADSISKAAKVITSHFYRYKVTVHELTENGQKEVGKQKGHLERYYQDILYVDKLPYQIYVDISDKVKRDLKKLNQLIHWYESTDFIRQHISKNKLPTNHEEAIQYDFYQRCISEQQKVLNYYLNNLKDRALQKASYLPLGLGVILSINEKHRDFPYKFHFSEDLFDYRLINEAGHRIGEFPMDESYKLEELYKINKASFYRKVLNKQRVEQIFKNFDFYTKHLPIKQDRGIIFKELKSLYNSKRWMAFFALALPQVEGLFTEMCEVAFPGQNNKSLSDKVKKIRPLYFLSESYFDYYQYIVPRIRNQFSHTGYSDDFKPKALDLLTDIDDLLKIFFELENAVVKIKKIHTSRKADNFISFKQYGEYFYLLSQLNPQQKNDFKSEIDIFEKDFLIAYCNADLVCDEVITTLPKFANDLMVNLEYAVGSAEIAFNIGKMPISKAKDLLQNQTFADNFERLCITVFDIEDIIGYHRFLSGYNKFLPSVNDNIIKLLDKLKKEHGTLIKNIYELYNIISNDKTNN